MSGAAAWGSEFTFDTTAGAFEYTSVAAFSDGRFIVNSDAWATALGDPSTSVAAQIFHADGSAAAPAFLVNTSTNDQQARGDIATWSDGHFVAVWDDFSRGSGDFDQSAIRAQFFDADGAKVGAELLVNTTTADAQWVPAVTTLDGGRFVVAWTDDSRSADDPFGEAVRAQIFNSDGSKSGAEFLVNTAKVGDQEFPVMATLSDGRFVVSWTDSSPAGTDQSVTAVRAQIYNADGTRSGGELQVNTTTVLGQGDPGITALSGGRFLETWTDGSHSSDDPSGYAVRGQVFNADGTKSGAEFLVNTDTALDQHDPSIVALPDGRFVVTFSEEDLNGLSEADIRLQVFNADGTRDGAELNLHAAGYYQREASVAALADGRFVVTWHEVHADPSTPFADELRGQIFDERDAAVHLTGTARGDEYFGTGFDDTMAGLGGNDHLVGAGGDDSLDGGAANDTLDGGTGNDTMAGGAGNDLYIVDSTHDHIVEASGGGLDTVYSTASFKLTNGVENLVLLGSGKIYGTGSAVDNLIIGNYRGNVLKGLAGNDTLSGGQGNDTLSGGSGKDYLIGGTGHDQFKYNALSNSGPGLADRDVISDFGHGDKVNLATVDANSGVDGNQAFTFTDHFTNTAGQLAWTQTAPNAFLVQGDVNGDGAADFSIQINCGSGISALHDTDFIL